jgi:putative hydrolase of HD superfamily
MPSDRLARQIAFLVEADKLKGVLRRTSLMDGSRRENSAEHSWHLLLLAIVLREHAAAGVDLPRVLEMLAVHDLVEIDAGDTFAYDAAHQATQAQRETAAADRVFGLLPADQARHLRSVWEEFEAKESAEARLAVAIDRLQPLLQNAGAGGGTWREHDLSRADVLARMAPIESALPRLWPFVMDVVNRFSASGVLRTSREA